MAVTLRKEKERLRGLLGMEPLRVLKRKYEPKRSQECFNITKKSFMIIMGILTDHCILNQYLGKLRISTNIVCKFFG